MKRKKILIIRFSSIGDIVLTSPVIRNVKEQLPDWEVHFCTKEKFKGIIESNPYIDKVFTLKNSLPDLIKELRKEKYDYIADLHNNLRSRIIKLALPGKKKSFNKLNLEKWLLVNSKINRLPKVHIVDRYMATVTPLGIKNDEKGLDYFIPADQEVKSEDLPTAYRNGYAAFAIGAQLATKKLPTNKIIEVIEKAEMPTVLLGGPEDAETGKKIEAYFIAKNKAFTVYNACGKFSLHQSASVIKQSKVVFTHDTGLMHIASAFKKPINSFWGNTIPEFGMTPYKTEFKIFENKLAACRPCSKIGFSSCPKGHFACMSNIRVRKEDFSG